MDRKELEAKVINLVVETLTVVKDRVSLDTDLREDLGVDSLDLVDLVLAVEQEFGIEVRDEDIGENIRTVRDIVDLLEKYLREIEESME